MRMGLEDVTLRRHGRVVLDACSLEASPGSTTAVVGGDGAGKTSVAQVLVGALQPDSGTVLAPPRERIGYVSAGPGIHPDLTVIENLRFAGTAYGLSGRRLQDRMDELLSVTALTEARDRLAARLSGGMRQKLAFACAVLHQPDLLVLDEPTVGVDPISRAQLWRLVSGEVAAGTAVVFTTTYLDEAQRADRILHLDTADGPAAEDGRATGPGPRPRHTAGDAHGDALLEVADLVVRFGANTAVDRASFEVRPGEVVGLLGANGAGKTTTIRAALGLQRATAGAVRLFGELPSRAGRRRVGHVPQGLGLWQDLTVRENLQFVAGAYGDVPTLPEGMRGEADTLVAALPLGLRRRVAFAAALGHHPELLVLDEPTSGVGPHERDDLWDEIHAARDDGAGVLVTTHHMNEAEQCDRVVVLMGGRLVASGTMATLLDDRFTVAVTTDDWPEAFTRLDRAFSAVALHGRQVRVPDAQVDDVRSALDGLPAEVSSAPASFDEVFVALGQAS